MTSFHPGNGTYLWLGIYDLQNMLGRVIVCFKVELVTGLGFTFVILQYV